MMPVRKGETDPSAGGLAVERRSGEAVHIGDNITVTVTRCGNGRCRLRIEAPEHVNIMRDELLKKRTSKGLHKSRKSRKGSDKVATRRATTRRKITS